MGRSIAEYAKFILAPFFRGWWALITGVVAITAFVFTPDQGIEIGRYGVVLSALFVSACLFLALSVLLRGWTLFRERYSGLRMIGVYRPVESDAESVFVFNGRHPLEVGSLVQVNRRMGDVEVPFALVHISERNARGDFQGTPVSSSPVHLRDHRLGRFSISEMVVLPAVRTHEVVEALPDLDEWSQEFR